MADERGTISGRVTIPAGLADTSGTVVIRWEEKDGELVATKVEVRPETEGEQAMSIPADEGYPGTPRDALNPDWHEYDKVHCWRNHVSEELQTIWHTFTDDQKHAIARWANMMASDEHWD